MLLMLTVYWPNEFNLAQRKALFRQLIYLIQPEITSFVGAEHWRRSYFHSSYLTVPYLAPPRQGDSCARSMELSIHVMFSRCAAQREVFVSKEEEWENFLMIYAGCFMTSLEVPESEKREKLVGKSFPLFERKCQVWVRLRDRESSSPSTSTSSRMS